MSLVTIVLGIGAVEVVIALILCIPLPALFMGPFIRLISKAKYPAIFVFTIVLIATYDAYNELNRVENVSKQLKGNTHDFQMEQDMKLKRFRAHRNFYVSAVSLILLPIIVRLSSLGAEVIELKNKLRDAKRS